MQHQLPDVQQIQASLRAFATSLGDGSVVTWGRASVVQDQLLGVQQIQASHSAFAAILSGGSVVTWCFADFGGKCSAVQDRLSVRCLAALT